MKKNGYTIIELTILLFVMATVTIIFLTKTSYAFKDSSDSVRYVQSNIIIKQATAYGVKIKKELIKSGSKTILVQTLIDSGYLIPDEDGVIISAEDETKTINSDKIEIKYDAKTDVISVIYPK